MIEKSRNTPTEWVDPDDAPELTAEFFEKATPMIGERVVTWEEFAKEARREGLPTKAENKCRSRSFTTLTLSRLLNRLAKAGNNA